MEILTFVLAIVALLWAFRNHAKTDELEKTQLLLQRENARLRNDLERRTSVPVEETTPKPQPAPQQEPPETREPPKPEPKPEPSPAPSILKPIERPPVPSAPVLREPPVLTTPRPSPTPRAPSAPKKPFDWEAIVGVQLFSWIAGIALVFAAIFFLKYSVEHGWLSPPVRMAIGLITGTALLVLCELKAARRYAITANALDAAGIAILFSTFFAGYALWELLGALPTFLLMSLVTATAVLLSVRHDSLFVALLGLLGGFATPALLSTGEDRPIGLFSYLLLLNAGLAWVAYRKRWPALTVVSTAFTTLYQWFWVERFLQAETIPLSLGIFLVFPVLSFIALRFGEQSPTGDEKSVLFQNVTAVSAALPLFFALYLASIPAYGSRYGLMFGFLFLIDAGLAAIAWKRGPEALHFAGGVVTVLTFCSYLRVSYTSAAWPAILGITAIFTLSYLAAGYWMPFKNAGKSAVFAAPLLLITFPVLAFFEPSAASPAGFFSALFVLITAIAAYALVRREPLVHLLAAFFAIAAGLVWSAEYLEPMRLMAALFLYLIFGLFYLAVPIVARRLAASDDPPVFDGSQYLALAGHGFLLFVVLQAPLSVPPWPFLGVLAVLNLAIGVAALYMRRSDLLLAALPVSQILLLAWQITVPGAPWPSVASLSALAISMMGFGCYVLTRRLGIAQSESSSLPFAVAGILPCLLGFLVVAVASALPGSPGVALLIVSTAILTCLLLALDHLTDCRFLAPCSVAAASAVILVWSGARFTPDLWSQQLIFAAALYAFFLAYPLWKGAAATASIEAHLTSILGSVMFFFFARQSLMAGGFGPVIGLLPVTQAALLSGLLWRLVKLEPWTGRASSRVALVAGAVLAFVTVAIPLQLEKQWIIIGWALQGAALAWLYRKIPHKGLIVWTSGLLAAVFVSLALNPAVLTYHPRSELPILNWYLYTYLISAAALLAAAWWLRHAERIFEDLLAISTPAAAGGVILLFLLLNIEIADYYSVGPTLTFNFSAGLAQNLTYTIAWGLFAFALLSTGILLVVKPARVAAILLLSVTVGKCFLLDLRHLEGLYRIGSFVGLAICLTLVALLLQRYVLRQGVLDKP